MGINKIKIHHRGEEGTYNFRGLSSLTELSVGHPLGVDPNFEYQGSPSDTNVRGGTVTYKILGSSKRTNSIDFEIEEIPNNLYQNYFENYFTTASIDPTDNFDRIGTLFTARRDNNTYFTTSSVTDIAQSFPLRESSSQIQFSSYVLGDELNWYKNSQARFDIEKIPNVFFKYTLDLWLTGENASNNPVTESIYITVGNTANDVNYWSRVGRNYRDSNRNLIRGTGALPLKKITVSASSGEWENHQVEFIVTQSYSRIYDTPLGPSIDGNSYYSKQSVNKKGVVLPNLTNVSSFMVFAASDYDFGETEGRWSSKKWGRTNPYRSNLKIEPITIIDPTDKNYTENPNTAATQPSRLSGSVVQPPSSRFQNPTFRGTFDSTYPYKGGDYFRFSNHEFIILYDDIALPGSASPPNNVYEQVQTGRYSTFNYTGSEGVWGQGLKGWRWTSISTTSSLIPLNNENDNFNVSEYNPLINSIDALRPSSIYYDLDYSRGIIEPLNRNQILSQSATKAVVVDSNYSSDNWSNIRYNGSRVTSNNINQI